MTSLNKISNDNGVWSSSEEDGDWGTADPCENDLCWCDDDLCYDDSQIILNKHNKNISHFKICNLLEVEKDMTKEVKKLAEILGDIHFDLALHLLQNNNWRKNKAYDNFFSNKYSCCNKYDLKNKATTQCMVCFETLNKEQVLSVCNEHYFCKTCWNAYLDCLIKDGKTEMYCMDPKCKAPVLLSFIFEIVNKNIYNKYFKWISKSFIESSEIFKYCPNVSCDFIINNSSSENKISCECGYNSCFKCSREHHYPASCNIMELWLKECNQDSENALWLMENTKNCPKCKLAIQKNQGCNHMTCSQCRHQFCWLCKEDWKKHGTATGGFYKCNKYIKMKQDGKKVKEIYDDSRFLHYFSRFKNHEESKNILIKDLKKIEIFLNEDISNEMIGEASFTRTINNTIKVILECRSTLKLSYPIGYLMKDDNLRTLFEYWQENLEKYCEDLHGLIEVDSIQELWVNRCKIRDYLTTTKQYHKNLCVKLSEIEI